MPNPPEWADVQRSAARLQQLVPDTVLVGGSAAVTHAHHRVSFDHDHVLTDLRDRFDSVLEALESTDGWVTRPVQILGSLDGVETGIRQLIRRRPLEVEQIDELRVPTLAETARVKFWMVLVRNATRDYLDAVALADRLGGAAPQAASSMDDYYADQRGPGGARIATQLAKQLAEPAPYDLDAVDLQHYRGLTPRWQDWSVVARACGELAAGILDAAARAGHRP